MSPSSRRAWIEIIQIRPPKERGDVALLAEGVDRNFMAWGSIGSFAGSPSSRRAWIEIFCPLCRAAHTAVALLAEGVDRNLGQSQQAQGMQVALLAEGVDRNIRKLYRQLRKA